ncbi:hypothetical protein M8998_14170 [Sphingobacterium sp. lm-10]|uniref:hypothetical protein n=1 Tax=Sphingobacterium sp. lm-10 TaxID=2944904 RepID=UPI00202225B7|nr:hypothetical protein [Sphingobacterium sp. lm-10]MCL7989091.1 hypothetical protein [Sphingobacterium sp. lm-10]
MKIKLLWISIFSLFTLTGFAQTYYYTQFQVGGQFGLRNPGYDGVFNGYAAHFIFGLNFNDRAYVGLGAGNETFRGSYVSTDASDRNAIRRQYDTYLMPLFIDARAPLYYLNDYSWIGILGNTGYAPRIGPVYDRGFLFRGGLLYVYETMRRNNYTVSVSYGYQELNRNAHDFGRRFQHQHLSLSLGLMLK